MGAIQLQSYLSPPPFWAKRKAPTKLHFTQSKILVDCFVFTALSAHTLRRGKFRVSCLHLLSASADSLKTRKAVPVQFLQKHRNRHGTNVDTTQTGIVFQYLQVQMIISISCLVVLFQNVLDQGRYSFQIFQMQTSFINRHRLLQIHHLPLISACD